MVIASERSFAAAKEVRYATLLTTSSVKAPYTIRRNSTKKKINRHSNPKVQIQKLKNSFPVETSCWLLENWFNSRSDKSNEIDKYK